jgi:hypothetical protein
MPDIRRMSEADHLRRIDGAGAVSGSAPIASQSTHLDNSALCHKGTWLQSKPSPFASVTDSIGDATVRRECVPNDLLQCFPHHHGMKVVECATDRIGAGQRLHCKRRRTAETSGASPTEKAKQSSREAQVTNVLVYDLEVSFQAPGFAIIMAQPGDPVPAALSKHRQPNLPYRPSRPASGRPGAAALSPVTV